MNDTPTPSEIATALRVVEWFLSSGGTLHQESTAISEMADFLEWQEHERTGGDTPDDHYAVIEWGQTCGECGNLMTWEYSQAPEIDYEPGVKGHCEHCSHGFAGPWEYKLTYRVKEIRP
jgi:hypothetical protein